MITPSKLVEVAMFGFRRACPRCDFRARLAIVEPVAAVLETIGGQLDSSMWPLSMERGPLYGGARLVERAQRLEHTGGVGTLRVERG